MHPCPCCGYKTLSARADYELCPVCWWEDDGVEPWEFSDPNSQTLFAGQQQYLARHRPDQPRAGKMRAPRKDEARDPDWRPYELTDEDIHRMGQAEVERERWWEEERRRAEREFAENPEGPFKEYNAAIRLLNAEAPSLSHREVWAKLRALSRAQGLRFDNADLELHSRLMVDADFYRGHPGRTAWWLLRYARPGTFKRRWTEVRTGIIRSTHVAG